MGSIRNATTGEGVGILYHPPHSFAISQNEKEEREEKAAEGCERESWTDATKAKLTSHRVKWFIKVVISILPSH